MSTHGEPSSADRAYLLRLQQRALHYFLENQAANGLLLDRQSNHGPRRPHGYCSTATTGMGFIALALASAAPYRLLSAAAAARRIRTGLHTALERLPHEEGMLPHFVDSANGAVHGWDHISTVDSAWLFAGALWAAEFLQIRELQLLADCLYERVDWGYWTADGPGGADGLLRHGKGSGGRFLDCTWDRLNGETAFMYVLAAGAEHRRTVPPTTWTALRPFYGQQAGHVFNNADLGLFVHQYGLDLLDLRRWRAPGAVDLWAEARLAAAANRDVCRQAADRFATYHRFWGLSAGDGPGTHPERDTYRAYSPAGPIDGTAHLLASLASVPHLPGCVLENLRQAERDPDLRAEGRYGFSNVNVDHRWVGRDVVGIDAGAAVLALDNYLMDDRVRRVFNRLPCVERGLRYLGFTRNPPPGPVPVPVEVRQAS